MIDFFFVLVVICWAVLFYAWIGYPAILFLLTKRSEYDLENKKKGFDLSTESIYLPSISILLSAYNEEKHINERIRNLTELDYPRSKTSIWIGIDSSEDLTAKICQAWSERSPRINVIEFKNRRGKIAVLKALVSGSKSEILIFTDANTFFQPDAIKNLISHFSNPSVGGVCGRLVFIGEKEEISYWQMENNLKRMESFLDSCLGANGAIYAIRRSLFWSDVPDNTIVDDFVIGMKVREQGKYFVYEPEAVAKENLPPTADEWRRRIRIGAGDYQALLLCYKCLSPKYKKFAWIFWSHKVLRWFTPHIFLVLFVFSIFILHFSDLSESLDLGVTNFFAGFGTFILLTIFLNGFLVRILRAYNFFDQKIFKFMRLFDHLFTMQAALLAGFIRFCKGNLTGYWVRSSRDR